jgi:chromosome partitioning protein
MVLAIGVLNQKGGVGKTTLAIDLADEMSRRNRRTLLTDADQQGSALDWGAARSEDAQFSIIGLPRSTIYREIGRLGQGYDAVVIDGLPRVYEVARSPRLFS